MANRAFIRFRNITIPNYSEVSSVFTRLTAYSDRSDTPVNLRCAFVNEDNPDAPISYAELQAFNLTDWVSWNSLGGWSDGSVYDSPDLTDIFQVVIERVGWYSGNSAILVIEDVSSSGQRGFSSIQFNSGAERAVLFATYIAREGTGEGISTVISEGETDVVLQDGRMLARSSNGDLHCIYTRRVMGVSGYVYWLCYAKSTNEGETWTETILLHELNSYFAKIAIDSNDYIHIVWYGQVSVDSINQIRYIKYETSWGSIENLTDEIYSQYAPSIAIDSNNYIHIVWHGSIASSGRQIRYIKYETSWGSIENLTSDTQLQYYPSIAIDGNNYIHIAWYGCSPSSPTVEQIRYIKYETSWGSITEVTNEGADQRNPSIAIDSNNYIHIVWHGKITTSFQIRYIKYETSWSGIINLTNESFQYVPSISIDSNNYIYVVWNGGHFNSPTTYQIRYTRYVTSWEGVQNLTNSSNHQRYPSTIWAIHPTISTLKTNRPKSGFAFVFFSYNGTRHTLRYYPSPDLTWDT